MRNPFRNEADAFRLVLLSVGYFALIVVAAAINTWLGVAVFLLLTLLAIGQAYFLAPAGRQITYSEFKSHVRAGQVAEVAVGDTVIHGTLKKAEGGSTAFTTTRVGEDPKLIEELDVGD